MIWTYVPRQFPCRGGGRKSGRVANRWPSPTYWQISTATWVHQCIIYCYGLMSLSVNLPCGIVDGSANNVLCRGGNFWEIAGIIEFLRKFSLDKKKQLELSQTKSQDFIVRRVKKVRGEGTFFKRSPAGRTPTVRMDEKRLKTGWNWLSSRAPSSSRDTGLEMAIERASFCPSWTCEDIQCACIPAISQKWPPRYNYNVFCWIAHMVRWSKVAPNQNNKWFIAKLMLQW